MSNARRSLGGNLGEEWWGCVKPQSHGFEPRSWLSESLPWGLVLLPVLSVQYTVRLALRITWSHSMVITFACSRC